MIKVHSLLNDIILIGMIKSEEKKSELGDVYFSLINVSRFLEADPEIQLKKSIQTFISRAKYVEDNLFHLFQL